MGPQDGLPGLYGPKVAEKAIDLVDASRKTTRNAVEVRTICRKPWRPRRSHGWTAVGMPQALGLFFAWVSRCFLQVFPLYSVVFLWLSFVPVLFYQGLAAVGADGSRGRAGAQREPLVVF